ncbi:MAG: hypothetical protein V4760_09745 [Bdellovibrionota bacterium]
MRDFARLVEDCDSLIKAGRVAEASKRLLGLNSARVPREWRLPLANLCRRSGLISTGMKLLFQVVYPERSRVHEEPASSGELAEYGVLLHRFGSLRESVEILRRADPAVAPETLLFQAFCHFNRWEYAASVPMLEQYVSMQTLPYQRFIGEVNLSAALVWSEQWERARDVVTKNIATAHEQNYGRLEGNSYELRAQIHIYRRDFVSARADLEASSKLLGTSGVVDSLFVRKWQTILESFESKDVTKLISLRQEAIERRDGETAREADRFRLLISFDAATFDHLLFGTPYPEFRKMLCRQMRQAPSKLEYLVGAEGARTLDIATGELATSEGKVETFKPGGKCHKVLDVLSRDFYRPTSLGGLFTELFPGEHFDVFSSPGRIHQILFRTRAWAKERGMPVEVKESDGFYSLSMGPGFALRVPYQHGDVSGPAIQWQKLDSLLAGSREFTAKEAREKLGIPRTSLQRLLVWAESEKKIERIGEYNSTLYRLAV